MQIVLDNAKIAAFCYMSHEKGLQSLQA